MLFKYSEGLIKQLESELPGKLGGTNGSTRCLFTKLGPDFSVSSSVLRLIMVKSEHDELSRLAAGAKKVGD